MLELIDCTSAAAEQKVVTFANTLSNALKANTELTHVDLQKNNVQRKEREALVAVSDPTPEGGDDGEGSELSPRRNRGSVLSVVLV